MKVELWVVLLLYGGGSMDDLRWLAGQGIRRLFRIRADDVYRERHPRTLKGQE